MKMRVFIIVIIVIALCGCKNSKNRNRMIRELRTETVVGKALPIIDSLYQDNMGDSYILLLCSPYDCGPCLSKAFEILRIIENSNISNRQWVVSVLDEPSALQRYYSYYDYVLFDADDQIRKSLKYIPTPVFLIADSDNVIMGSYFPDGDDNSINMSKIIINNLKVRNYEEN